MSLLKDYTEGHATRIESVTDRLAKDRAAKRRAKRDAKKQAAKDAEISAANANSLVTAQGLTYTGYMSAFTGRAGVTQMENAAAINSTGPYLPKNETPMHTKILAGVGILVIYYFFLKGN